ncbi:hypothetical protein [Streptosporangium roseum]
MTAKSREDGLIVTTPGMGPFIAEPADRQALRSGPRDQAQSSAGGCR